jgi:hypothetical protein
VRVQISLRVPWGINLIVEWLTSTQRAREHYPHTPPFNINNNMILAEQARVKSAYFEDKKNAVEKIIWNAIVQ